MTGLVITATCWLAVCSIPLIWTDIKTRRLPNVITVSAYIGTAALLGAAAATGDHWDRLIDAVLSGITLAVFYLTPAVMLPRSMGLGELLTELRRFSPRAADITERGCLPSLRAVSGA